MSTGTEIIQDALSHIGAHSPIKPASPEAIEIGRRILNSLIARWADDDINFGSVPLQASGDELSEPIGLTSAIVFNLSIELHPLFPGSQVSPFLSTNAIKTYQDMRSKVQVINIPKQVVRKTLPKGQGNKNTRYEDHTFFTKGETIGG